MPHAHGPWPMSHVCLSVYVTCKELLACGRGMVLNIARLLTTFRPTCVRIHRPLKFPPLSFLAGGVSKCERERQNPSVSD